MRIPRLTRQLIASSILGGALVLAPTVALAASNSGTDSRTYPERVFSDSSFWYRKLPDATPVAPNSGAIVDHLYDQAEDHWGEPGEPNVGINTSHYTPPIYVARNSDPKVTFGWNNCQRKSDGDAGLIANHLTGIHIPADAVPARGTDSEMVVYNADTGMLTEVWKASKSGGRWTACWGGSIPNARAAQGVHSMPFGVSASGLPLAGGVITAEELRTGRIDHVVGLAIPFATPRTYSWPATRTDGRNPSGRATIAQGQMMRLPASLDLDSLNLSPAARAIAQAAQDYGIIIWDTSGAVSFRAENPIGMKSDPYPAIFRGRHPAQEMLGNPSRGEDPFPLDQLEVLPMDYRVPSGAGSTSSSPAPKPAPAPEPAPAPAPKPAPAPAPAPVGGTAALTFSDEFTTNRSSGWGGAWHVWPYDRSAVNGGDGVLRLPSPGSTAYATARDVSERDVEVRASFEIAALPSGSGQNYSVLSRVAGGNEYRTTLNVRPDGAVWSYLTRYVGGRETVLASSRLGGLRVAAGQVLEVRSRADGGSTVDLAATVWVRNAAEPTTPQLTAQDKGGAVSGAGSAGISVYRHADATTAADVRLDRFVVRDLG